MGRLYFSKGARQTSEEMEKARLGAQAGIRKGARQRVMARMLASPDRPHWRSGRAEDGSKILTFSLPDLRITMYGPAHVEILFRREKPIPDDFIIGDKIPREQVRYVTDIYRAVRLLDKHIQETYATDLERINDTLKTFIDPVHSILVNLKRRATPEKITEVVERLRPYSVLPQEDPDVSATGRLVSAYKRCGILQLRKAIEMLEKTAERNGPRINFETRSACGLIFSYKNWLDNRRVRQQSSIEGYNKSLRAPLLRAVRDRCMRELFSRYAEQLSGADPAATAQRMEQRNLIVGLFQRLGALPEGRGWREPAIKEIDDSIASIPDVHLRKSLLDARKGIDRGIVSRMMDRQHFLRATASLAKAFPAESVLEAESPETVALLVARRDDISTFIEKIRNVKKGRGWRQEAMAEIDAFLPELPECPLRASLIVVNIDVENFSSMDRGRFIRFADSLAKALHAESLLAAESDETAVMLIRKPEILAFFEKIRQLPKGTEWREPILKEISSFASGLPECQLKKSLRKIYAAVRSGMRNGVWNKDRLNDFIRAVAPSYRVRDPGYIAAELRKSDESYTRPVIEHLDGAVSALEDKKYSDAANHFTDAVAILRKPQQQVQSR